jgi:hypothetical protein
VCPVPRGIKVAAIKGDQPARCFEDRVRLFVQHLTAGVRKSRRKAGDRVKLADQHCRSRRGGLPDLIERQLAKALEPHRGHPYPEPTAFVVPVPSERGAFGQSEQRVGEPVNAGNACKRVINRGRQRTYGDLDDLCDAELAILRKRAVSADYDAMINRNRY